MSESQSLNMHHMPGRHLAHERHDSRLLTCFLWGVFGVVWVMGCEEQSVESTTPATQQVAEESIDASLSAINQYMQTGEWAKAEAIARTLVNRAPTDSRSHEILGQLLIEKSIQSEPLGDTETARALRMQAWKAYERAVQLSVSNAGLHHSAGLIAMNAGLPEAALDMFLKAERLDETNPQYPLFAAQILLQERRLDEAEAALNRALVHAPDEPYVHASLAMLALERSQFDVALTRIAAARRAEPDSIEFRAQHAKILRRQNEPRAALELLVGLAPAERSKESVAIEIAAAYEALGKPAKAADAWAACCQANPLRPGAYRAAVRAGELFVEAGELQNAAQWARIAQQLNASAPEVIALLDRLDNLAVP